MAGSLLDERLDKLARDITTYDELIVELEREALNSMDDAAQARLDKARLILASSYREYFIVADFIRKQHVRRVA